MTNNAQQISLADVLDRLAISELKAERLEDEDAAKEAEHWTLVLADVSSGVSPKKVAQWRREIKEVHKEIWTQEWWLRINEPSGGEPLDALKQAMAEVFPGKEYSEVLWAGVRATRVRNTNRERVRLRDEICRQTKTGFVDVAINSREF